MSEASEEASGSLEQEALEPGMCPQAVPGALGSFQNEKE